MVFGTGSERLVLQSQGAFIGQVLGGTTGSSTTMELAGGTNGTLSNLAADSGTVTDGAGSFSFTAFETIAVDSGATWVIDAPGTLDTLSNAGALSLAGGAVTVTGSLANSGSLSIAGNTLVASGGAVFDPGAIGVTADGLLQAGGSGVVVSGILGASGGLTVAGLGSRLVTTGQLSVGLGGDGSLLIENQATAITGGNTAAVGFDIGQTGSGPGNGTVPGSGAATVSNALLSNTGRFVVGDAGLGSLSITEGGTVTTSAAATIASAAGSDGSSVNVTGAGSSFQIAGALTVGNAGAGALSITAGATVTAASLDEAATATGAGVVTVAGTATALTLAGSLTVGDHAAGELSILGGATVTAQDLTIGNASALSSGNVDIEGAGSELLITTGGAVEHRPSRRRQRRAHPRHRRHSEFRRHHR